jgi:hypothetical protein
MDIRTVSSVDVSIKFGKFAQNFEIIGEQLVLVDVNSEEFLELIEIIFPTQFIPAPLPSRAQSQRASLPG